MSITVGEWRNTNFGLPTCALPMHSVAHGFPYGVDARCVCVGPRADFVGFDDCGCDDGIIPFSVVWNSITSISFDISHYVFSAGFVCEKFVVTSRTAVVTTPAASDCSFNVLTAPQVGDLTNEGDATACIVSPGGGGGGVGIAIAAANYYYYTFDNSALPACVNNLFGSSSSGTGFAPITGRPGSGNCRGITPGDYASLIGFSDGMSFNPFSFTITGVTFG